MWATFVCYDVLSYHQNHQKNNGLTVGVALIFFYRQPLAIFYSNLIFAFEILIIHTLQRSKLVFRFLRKLGKIPAYLP